MKRLLCYFSKLEWGLWISSVLLIVISTMVFPQRDYYTMISSLVGVTSLIFCAKGNPIGQILMVAFSLLYGVISFSFAYYGEMWTYLGMTLPMSIIALVSWLRHPYGGNKAQVQVKRLSLKEFWWMLGLSFVVTVVFYFLLKACHTANLLPSTISVTTSFIAAYLTFRRSPYFALAYAANDVVLIVLWGLATYHDPSYLSVLICFIVFLVNDLYSFFNWRRMEKRQRQSVSDLKT